ncbi:hypothetical protein NQ318_019670 [Aromia moschata]|uniref:Uncharacterized protein n=1 Tax=Aromia moschata TaxID=1265417 RepID=A0AAV8Z5X3_9CUCU|nr:hypothetical protein NQ318_019670 [Aromia moschata]
MWDCPQYAAPMVLIGILTLFFFLFDALWSLLQVCRAVLAPLFIPNEETSLTKKYGPWALITGSTDGIGRAYAFELAKRGLSIVLVSRNEEKLKKTAREIEMKFSVKTKTIAADFSQGSEAIEIVKKEVGKLPIDILVNNVGKNYEYPMYLTEVPEKDLVDIVNINVLTVTLMCRCFIDDMKKRGRGAIVNSYIKSFTAALRFEYRRYGVTVQHLAPMFVDTKMNAFSKRLQRSKFYIPNAEEYARYAVATLGKLDESTGYWTHGIQCFFISMVPVWIRTYIGAHMNLTLRKDYFRENHIPNDRLNRKEKVC